MKRILRMFSLALILSLLLSTVGLAPILVRAAANWEPVGAAGFTASEAYSPKLVLDNGIPYVAFQDYSKNNKATVMKFNGTSWETVGAAGFSAGYADYLTLAMDNGTPYVAYGDATNGNKATVMKFNGLSWETVGSAGFSSGFASDVSLALDNGTPFVAYQDGLGGKATVMKFNGSSWQTVGSAGFSAGSVAYTSLALDNGTPFVAYQDSSNQLKATVMKFNGSSWQTVGSAGFSADLVAYTSLALDNGTPYVAYQDIINGEKATVMKFDGSSWAPVGAAGFSAGGVGFISLTLANGMPFVTYQDIAYGWGATVMRFNGLGWEPVGVPGFSAASVGDLSLALANETVYVAYTDAGNSWKATVMKSTGDFTFPTVTSIVPAGVNQTLTGTVDFTVTFSEPVLGVAANDFAVYTTQSLTWASVHSVSGAGAVYTVTANMGVGVGTLRLDVPASASITDAAGNSLAKLPFTNGGNYAIANLYSFTDVEREHWAWQYVERLYNAKITGGCNIDPIQYCPESTVTRAQMAIFLLRGIHGSSYAPPAVGASTGFGDVPTGHWAAAWVKQLAAEGITSGCGGGDYCPEASVTRGQMAVFLLRAKHGLSYSPPAVGGSTGFGDVQPDHWAGSWIKQLVVEGITAGCGNNNYCPESPVTRAEMAVFLVRTFNLP